MRRRDFRMAGIFFLLCVGTTTAQTPAPEAFEPALETALGTPLELEDCIRIALENNLELRIARTNYAATATTVDEALGAFLPEFGLTADRTNWTRYGELPNREEKIRFGTASVTQLLPLGTTLSYSYGAQHLKLEPDRSDTPRRLVQFNVTQPLLRGAGWRATTAPVRAARYETEIATSNLRGSELDVVAQVKAAYYEVLRQAKLIDVNAKAVSRDSLLLRQSQSKLDAGLGTRRDLLSAEIILEQDRGRLVDATTAHDDALDGLVRVMGLRVGRRVTLAQKDVALDPVEAQEAAWIAKALRDNPRLQAARTAVELGRLDKHVAGNARLPQVDLSLIYNRDDDPDLNEERKLINIQRALEGNDPKDLEFTAFRGWTGLLTLSYPLGNKTLGSAYRRSRILLEQQQRNLEDLERQVVLELRTTMRSLDNNLQRLAILEKNIEGARSKLEFASINFQLGRASNLDITEAQKDLIDAEVDYVNQVIDYRVQLATIEALVGGFE